MSILKKSVLGLFLIACVTVLAILLFQQFKPTYTYHPPSQAAFVISFDDQYVESWHKQRGLFKKYQVHATFFVTNPYSLSPKEVSMLKDLVSDGHEVASHGYLHINSLTYSKEHGTSKYIAQEIVPSIKSLHKAGFAPVTFAYPYGANSWKIDYELLKYFLLLRGDSWKVEGKGIDELDKIFYSFQGERVINGLGIDVQSGVTLQDIETGFKRAAKNREAIVIYAHNITESGEPYTIAPETLEAIFKLAHQYKIQSLSFKSLVL